MQNRYINLLTRNCPAGTGSSTTESAPAVTVDWTIEEAIENNMRFDCQEMYSLYAKDSVLYASYNSVWDTTGFSAYAEQTSEGTTGTNIKEIQLEHYKNHEIILDSNGDVWYKGRHIFPGYKIKYFDCFFVTSAAYRQVIAGVTEEGKVLWVSADSTKEPMEVPGLENVKYVASFWDKIAFVREDGTAGYCRTRDGSQDPEEPINLEGWSDIAMIYINGQRDDYANIIGLKNDGTLAAQTIYGTEADYPDEIFS